MVDSKEIYASKSNNRVWQIVLLAWGKFLPTCWEYFLLSWTYFYYYKIVNVL